MKFGIFSDIHSNLEGLTAVLEDMHKMNVTHTVCLGDIVGYNANPKECLQLVRELGCPTVMGNHDEMVSQNGASDSYNVMAGEGIKHSRDSLDNSERAYLRSLPMQLKVQGYTIVHASLDDPQRWNYINSALEASSSFIYQYTSLCFIGHTHVAQVFVKQGNVREISNAHVIKLQKGARYLVNVGSVGQPRDRNWKSSYVIYSPEEEVLEYRRIPYDIEKTQRKIMQAGLSLETAERLKFAV